MSYPNKREKQYESEIKLRGTALIVSACIEAIIMSVIYYSNSEQYSKAIEPVTSKTKHLTFGAKISLLKDLLDEFHPDLLTTYKNLFEDLSVFLSVRNKMAHCAFEWLDDECETLNVWDNADHFSGKLRFYTPIKCKTSELAKSINDSFQKIPQSLISLQNEVESRLKKDNPDIYQEIEDAIRKVEEK